jgi:hypothetical protein
MADQRQVQGNPQNEREQSGSDRNREERLRSEGIAQDIVQNKHRLTMERALDKTIADSFPASDPPSSIPDPGEEEPFAA